MSCERTLPTGFQAEEDSLQFPSTPAVNYSTGRREFASEFDTTTRNLIQLSLTRRPDAISFNYLTSFTFGPIAIGDTSAGIIPYVWRIRILNSSIYYARETLTKDDWLPDTLLLTYEGVAVSEVDAGFDQFGRLVVTAQRGNDVWLYYYNSLIAAYEFVSFGNGRNPRVLLDNPDDITDSDVLFFYVSDSLNKIVYRQQRDRYLTIYDTPITVVANKYLEDIVKATDSRIHIVYSERFLASGTYEVFHIESALYPQILPPEIVEVFSAVLSGVLLLVVITSDASDSLTVIGSVRSGTLTDPIIISNAAIETVSTQASIQSGLLVLPLILNNAEIETLSATGSMRSGILILIVILDDAEIETLSAQASVQSGTLAIFP